MNIGSSSPSFTQVRSSNAGLRPAALNASENVSAPSGRPGGLPSLESPQKLREAGQQFEALLITQLLQSARGSGTGWLGTPEDSTSDCTTGYAEQQFAESLAHAGGLGIAHMIENSLSEPMVPPKHSSPAPGHRNSDTVPGNSSPSKWQEP